ncbi:CD1375 family protein [Paenibacillus xylanilyticus]|nr:CD1375 family protein [Paenibacillus xylanilyticus]
MLAIYVALIHKGIITIEAVPASSRNKVADALEAAGMDQKGNIV